jgi:hypothetical protein
MTKLLTSLSVFGNLSFCVYIYMPKIERCWTINPYRTMLLWMQVRCAFSNPTLPSPPFPEIQQNSLTVGIFFSLVADVRLRKKLGKIQNSWPKLLEYQVVQLPSSGLPLNFVLYFQIVSHGAKVPIGLFYFLVGCNLSPLPVISHFLKPDNLLSCLF